MKVTFLVQRQAQDALVELTRTCESMEWAVAWATPNLLVDEVLRNRKKLRHLVIGTHLYQTHPDVLQSFLSESKVRVMPPTGDLFHPKVYLFTSGDSIRAVVGSHNLTHSAMHHNVEASVLIDGSRTDQAFIELQQFVRSAWGSARTLDAEFLVRYESQYKAKSLARESLTAFVDYPLSRKEGTGRTPHEMGWADYVQQVTAPRKPAFQAFLAVLDGVQRLFAKYPSFTSMSAAERGLVAGTAGRKKSIQGGTDYQLFGSMAGSGSFASVVLNAPEELSRALDAIPSSGAVSEYDYDRFVSHFMNAFVRANAKRTGGVATATRLLAMKRPDVFVCVNNANQEDLCSHFGVAPSTMRLDNYWQRIILPMMQTEWWRAPMPASPLEDRIWRGRAALLDTIYYDRSAHGMG